MRADLFDCNFVAAMYHFIIKRIISGGGSRLRSQTHNSSRHVYRRPVAPYLVFVVHRYNVGIESLVGVPDRVGHQCPQVPQPEGKYRSGREAMTAGTGIWSVYRIQQTYGVAPARKQSSTTSKDGSRYGCIGIG